MTLTEPGNDTADDVAARQANVDVERVDLRKTCGLEKEHGKAENAIAAEDLCRPDHTVLLSADRCRYYSQFRSVSGWFL